MSKAIRVEVTQEDISSGVRSDCLNCPIAKAIRRSVGKVAYVGPVVSYMGTSKAILPAEASEWVRTFDRGMVMSKPIAFDLEFKEMGE